MTTSPGVAFNAKKQTAEIEASGSLIMCTVCLTAKSGPSRDLSDLLPKEQKPISTIVRMHLDLAIEEAPPDHGQRRPICNTCWTMLIEFHTFYRMVQDAQMELKPEKVMNDIPLLVGDGEAENQSYSTEFVSVKPTSNKPIAETCAPPPLDSHDAPEMANEALDGKSERKTAVDQEILDFYKRIICEICDPELMARGVPAIEYNTLRELNRHMRTEHNVAHGALRCPVCERKYRTRTQLYQHKEMHLDPDRFRCTICSEVHHNMEEHQKKRHGERTHSCPECGKRFVFKGRLAVHMRIAHTARDILCDKCNKPFNKYTIEEHRRVVHEASFICEYCSKTFKSRFWLNRHMQEHNEGVGNVHAVTCTICQTVVKNKYILLAHMRRVHSAIQAAVNCKLCGKSFKSRNNLTNHLRNVCTDRSFPCAVCGKQFKQRVKLKEHMTMHTGMALYGCNFCPQTFKYEAQFYQHRKQAHHEKWLEIQQRRKAGHRPATQLIRAADVEPTT